MSQEIEWAQGQLPEAIPFWQPGYDSLNSLLSVFQNKPGVEIEMYRINEDRSSINVVIKTLFLFDRRELNIGLNRELPDLSIDSVISDGFPSEFLDLVKPRTENFYPENFQAYVAQYLDKIRKALGLPDLTPEEALDALVPNGDFQKWQKECSEWRRQKPAAW